MRPSEKAPSRGRKAVECRRVRIPGRRRLDRTLHLWRPVEYCYHNQQSECQRPRISPKLQREPARTVWQLPSLPWGWFFVFHATSSCSSQAAGTRIANRVPMSDRLPHRGECPAQRSQVLFQQHYRVDQPILPALPVSIYRSYSMLHRANSFGDRDIRCADENRCVLSRTQQPGNRPLPLPRPAAGHHPCHPVRLSVSSDRRDDHHSVYVRLQRTFHRCPE